MHYHFRQMGFHHSQTVATFYITSKCIISDSVPLINEVNELLIQRLSLLCDIQAINSKLLLQLNTIILLAKLVPAFTEFLSSITSSFFS